MHLSFISMRATVTKFEEKLFEQDVVVMETYNRHGNDIIGIDTKFHLHACYIYHP